MSELEKKMLNATLAADAEDCVCFTDTDRNLIAVAAAKIALEEIKAAFEAGENYGMHNVGVYKNLEEYLKQKGYE